MAHLRKKPVSKVYWFKCWRENLSGDESTVWRFSLENPNTGERLGFASLEEMVAHIKSTLREENAWEGDIEK